MFNLNGERMTLKPGATRARPSLHGTAVLIAEDEYFIANELVKAVRRLGGEVVGPVATQSEALQLLKSERIDCSIVDINLRGELAFPLVDELMRCNIPLVFATGYTGESIPAGYRHLPRWVKPYLPMTLAYALRNLA